MSLGPAELRAAAAELGRPAGLALVAGLGWIVLDGERSELWALPFATAAALVFRDRAWLLVVAAFGLVSFSGTITAFTDLRPAQGANGLIAALWLVAGLRLLSRRGGRRPWLWPAGLLLATYVVITAGMVPLAEDLELGLEAFRQQAWFMLAGLLIAYGPWPASERERIVKGLVAVVIAAGAYSVWRWTFGFSPEELIQARVSLFNLPFGQEPRFFGTFDTANHLALWAAPSFVATLSLAFAWRGGWARAAATAALLCAFCVVASDVRIAIGAIAVGAATVLFLQLPARSTAARLRPRVAAAVVAAPVAALLAWAAIIAGDETRAERFAAILDPSNDISYLERAARWDDAVQRIEEGPVFGYGLGTQGTAAVELRELGSVGHPGIDSTYLKVAIEQGVPIAAFLFGGLAVIGFALGRAGLLRRDRLSASLAISGSGIVVVLLIMFLTAGYIEGYWILPAWILLGLGMAAAADRPGRVALSPRAR